MKILIYSNFNDLPCEPVIKLCVNSLNYCSSGTEDIKLQPNILIYSQIHPVVTANSIFPLVILQL